MDDPSPLVQTGQIVEASSDERTMSAVCHALAGLFGIGLVGIIIPLVIYSAYQDRSKYVRFHALQAIVFQVASAVLVWLIAVPTCGVGLLLALGPMAVQLYWAYLAWQGSWKPYPMLEKVGL